MTGEVTKEMMMGSEATQGEGQTNLSAVIVKNKYPIDTTITDIDMPFISMVSFMVKLVIASIPALIILVIFFAVVASFFGAIFGHRG